MRWRQRICGFERDAYVYAYGAGRRLLSTDDRSGGEGRAMKPTRWKFVRRPGVGITALLTVGSVLALGLLAQTIINYRYVSSSLIRQEARRVVEDIARALERDVRSSRPEDVSAFSTLIQEFQSDRREQIAWMVVRQGRGNVMGASRRPGG